MKGDELETILKGHLLIEDLLNQILAASTANPKLIKQADLSFYKTALVVQALHEEKAKEWLWKALLGLNAIRNKLAHHLDYPNLEEMISEFVALVSSKANIDPSADEFFGNKALPSRISRICIE